MAQAVREAEEIGEIARCVTKIREDLMQVHYGERRLGPERAPRVREPTSEGGDPHTGERSSDIARGALPPSLPQPRQETCEEQRYCPVGDE